MIYNTYYSIITQLFVYFSGLSSLVTRTETHRRQRSGITSTADAVLQPPRNESKHYKL